MVFSAIHFHVTDLSRPCEHVRCRWLLQITWPFLTPFILASIFDIVMNPVRRWLCRRIHRAGLATFLTTTATALLLTTVLMFTGFALTQELTAAYDALNKRSLETLCRGGIVTG